MQRYELVITQAGNYMQSDPEGDYVLYDEAKAIEEKRDKWQNWAIVVAMHLDGKITGAEIREWVDEYKKERDEQIASLTSDIEILRNMNRILHNSLVKLRTEVADYREALEQIIS